MRLFAALACLALSPVTLADTIHSIIGGGYYHHQSNWVFPEKVGDFSLVGVPQDINGTDDAAAYYARVAGGVRTVASVSLYAPDSAEPETNPASIKGKPVAFDVSKRPRLTAAKLVIKDGTSARTTLYFIDTGHWTIKVRATTPLTDKAIAPVLDAFTRNLRWDSLQVPGEKNGGNSALHH